MARKTSWENLSDSDLIEQLDEAKEEVFKLRFQIVTGRLDNTARLKQAKREVARAMTELRMREIRRKVREGMVTSVSMDKTAVVVSTDRVRHRRYNKTVQRNTRLYVHDESNQLAVGDRVRVQETRPLSKTKRWRLVEILERAR